MEKEQGGEETAERPLYKKNTCLFTLGRVGWNVVDAIAGAGGSKKTRRLGRQRRASSVNAPHITNHRTSAKSTDGTAKVWLNRPLGGLVTQQRHSYILRNWQDSVSLDLPCPTGIQD